MLRTLRNGAFYGFFAAVLLTGPALAEVPPASLESSAEQLALTPHMEYIADPGGEMQLADVIASTQWSAIPGEIQNIGFNKTPHWYRIKLLHQEQGTSIDPWYLEIAYPLLDNVDLYIPNAAGGYDRLQSGDQRPFDERPVKHRNIVFPVQLPAGQALTAYMWVQTESTHTLPITLWRDRVFIKKSNDELAVLGMYYGIMLIMILYNGFIFLSVREGSYLNYMAFILCGGILLPVTINGLGVEYLWGYMPRWTNVSVLIATGLAIITGLRFTQATLEAREKDPLFYRLINSVMLLTFGQLILVCFVEYSLGIRVSMMLGLLAAATIVAYAVRSAMRGQRAAQFFVLGWAAFLCGILLKVLQGHGLLPTNLLTIYSMQGGMVLQVTLLSLALADRINRERSAKLAAQNEVIKAREGAISHLKQYRQIFENVFEGICKVDSEGRIIGANPALARIFGYESPEQLMHEIHDYCVQMFSSNEDPKYLGRQLKRYGHVQGFQARMQRADGSLFWAEINLRQELDEEGKIHHIDCMIADIQQRKETETLERERQRAEAATLAKSEFLAKMSHEIRTPMNAIIGFTDLALRSQSDAKRIEYLGQIRTGSTRLLHIINDILDFSRIESGKLQLESHPFRLQCVLDRLADMFARAAAEKGTELLIVPASGLPSMLVGDSLRLEQVLINLVGNAIKFTDQGEVELKVEVVSTNGRRVELKCSVRDTGIGLTEEQQGRLFSVFSQADESITRKYGGTGLGLSISRQLVEMMGGTIGLSSIPGEGSCFWVHLPLGIAPDSKDSGIDLCLPSPMRNRMALVVDDNPGAGRIYGRMLENIGMQVTTVDNGEAAIDEIQRKNIDLVLLDWQMPGLNGFETGRRIRALPKGGSVPIILMSACGCDEQAAGIPGLSFEACLAKPIKPSTLFGAVQEVLQGGSNAGGLLPNVMNLPEAKHLEGSRLLLVEDNPLNQNLACELLASLGAKVDVAQNGWEAVEAVQHREYDVVLMDIQMPELDGYEATRKIRSDLGMRDLPIIGLTANALPRERDLGLEAGMNDYMTKPIDLQEMVYVLRQQIVRDAAADQEAVTPGEQSQAGPQPVPAPDEMTGCTQGEQALYAKRLADFYRRYSQADMEIRLAYERDGGKQAAAEAQALKTAASKLGLLRLHAVTCQLEVALTRCNGEAPEAELQAVSAAMTEVWPMIQKYLPGNVQSARRQGVGNL